MSSSVPVSSRLRAGGKFLAFAVVAALAVIGHNLLLNAIPLIAAALTAAHTGATPLWLTLVIVVSSLAYGLGLTALAARLERRSLADYGFPLRQALGRRFWL